jgi:hypothetical protein
MGAEGIGLYIHADVQGALGPVERGSQRSSEPGLIGLLDAVG